MQEVGEEYQVFGMQEVGEEYQVFDNVYKKGAFPPSIIEKGLYIEIETAEASIAKDKDAILRMISGVSDQELPPSGHVAYDRLNAKSRVRFLVCSNLDQAQ